MYQYYSIFFSLESVFEAVNADKDKQEAKEAAAYAKKGAG